MRFSGVLTLGRQLLAGFSGVVLIGLCASACVEAAETKSDAEESNAPDAAKPAVDPTHPLYRPLELAYKSREALKDLKDYEAVFIKQEIVYALRRRLDPGVWRVTAADLAVAIGEDIRYPDIVVEPANSEWSALFTDTPVFLAEVLSPSSLALDFRDKAAEYMSMASLEAYLVAAQDEPRMWLWQRPGHELLTNNGDRSAFPAAPQEIDGLEATFSLAALGVTVQLKEIYARIVASR